MGDDRIKNVAEWFYSQVFSDEVIQPKKEAPKERMPALLKTALSLSGSWQSRESIFLKQARLLQDFEDDCPFEGTVSRYYPTYDSLTDQELRGYFTWRTKLRRGEPEKAPLTFAFLYIYELLNQVGAADPMDGYRKLLAFRDGYGAIDSGVVSYLKRWLHDYVIYYDLDPSLLEGIPQVTLDKSIAVLEHIQTESPAAILKALDQLPLRWRKRSKFCQQHKEAFDAVMIPVLRRVALHCNTRCKRGFTAQYLGGMVTDFVWLFEAAIFCNPLKRTHYSYQVDAYRRYRCRNGRWTVEGFVFSSHQCAKLDELTKAIDSLLRQKLDPKHPIMNPLNTKWILKIIQEEIDAYLAATQAKESKKVTIDRSQLAQIRRDAAITQEKLAVEDEWEEEPPTAPAAQAASAQTPPADTPLAPAEYRLLQGLLYGYNTGWVRAEGQLLSVLLDGINDKLYETFQDTVLDEEGQPIPDYIDELKEMVSP